MYIGLVDYYEFKGRNDVELSWMYVFMLLEKVEKVIECQICKKAQWRKWILFMYRMSCKSILIAIA